MTSLVAAPLGPSSGVAVGRIHSGDMGVALPCASATRSRLLPEVFDDSSTVCRWLSLRDRAIIREVNEKNFLEAGGTVDSELCEKKWGSPHCLLTWHHLHVAVSIL